MTGPPTPGSIDPTMLVRLSLAALAIALVVLAVVALRGDDAPVSASQAEAAALNWAGVGEPERARRAEDGWEVDVVRPDGSLVEVTIGDQLELLALDEELGPGGRPAHDEVTGARRERAIRAALAAAGPGRVLSVERDSRGDPEVTEVNLRREDGTAAEVDLDARLRVIEVQSQDPGDE